MASVTVPNENVPVRCVHPYPIHTDQSHVGEDPKNNGFYFQITHDDFKKGYKRYKKTNSKIFLMFFLAFG